MDRRLSRSMPLLGFPVQYSPITFRPLPPGWHDRCRQRARHYYIGGVRTQLIGADSYPNPTRSPRRLILCGPAGSYQKMTRSSSTAELSRSGVYCSRGSLVGRAKETPQPRRAASCEDVYRTEACSSTWDSRLSESGVSLNDSRTDLGSCVGLEDVDGVSQCSFESSSAFHEITCDSEVDRPDSDCVSVPSSGYYSHRDRNGAGHDGSSRTRRRDRAGGGGGGGLSQEKVRHNSGSREKFLADLTASSGRSSPQEEKEFYHSTPTKRGSPVLSIFPADEEDLHFPSHSPKDSFHDSLNQSSADSLLSPLSPPIHSTSPTSPPNRDNQKKKKKTRETSEEPISSSMEAVKEALKRRRQQFFSSLQDCSRLEERSAGESVQSWLTTGHPQRHALLSPLTVNTELDMPYHDHQQQQQQQQETSSPPSSQDVRTSVRDRVRAIERDSDSPYNKRGLPVDDIANSPTQKHTSSNSSCSGESNKQRDGATPTSPLSPKRVGGAERASCQQLVASPGSGTITSSLHPCRTEPASNEIPSSSPYHAARAHLTASPGTSGFNQQGDEGENPTSSLLSSSQLSDNLRETPFERKSKHHESGTTTTTTTTTSTLSEEDNIISDGRAASARAKQLSGGNYGVVSGNDSPNNTGADPAIANSTRPSISASTGALLSLYGYSETSLYRNSVDDTEQNTTQFATQDGHPTSDATTSAETRNVKDGENIAKSERDPVLYHARPIHIAAPGERDGERLAEHYQNTVTCPSFTENNDNPTLPRFRSPTSSPSQENDVSSCELDDNDVEVQSVLGGLNSQPESSLSIEEQDVDHLATDMAQRHHAPHWSLLPDSNSNNAAMTLSDVSQHHARHVRRQRTTVEETVTTRHTVRRYAGSPTSVLGKTGEEETTSWLGSYDKDYEMTDRTVSKTTVTEVDSEREETRTISKHPLSHSNLMINNGATDHSQTLTCHEQNQAEKSIQILENLQKQLLDLSFEEDTFPSSALHPQTSSPPVGYRDHAEALLEQTHQQEADSMSDSSGVVRGTGSVSITLDRTGSSRTPRSDVHVSGMTDNSGVDWETDGLLAVGSLTPDSGHDASLYSARAIEVVPNADRVSSEYSKYSALSSQPVPTSLWGPTGFSSEINDSDDCCTPPSVTDSSHPRPYSDSEGESRPEKSSAIHEFRGFLCGLQDQFTSDRPTLHRSVDMMAQEFPPPLFRPSSVQETILEADDERDSSDEELLSPTILNFKSSLHFCMPQSELAQAPSVSSVPETREVSSILGEMKATIPEESIHEVSSIHHLQELSDKLARLSDLSNEITIDQDPGSPIDTDLTAALQSHQSSPPLSSTGERSVYSASASAEVQSMSEGGITQGSVSPPSSSSHKLTNRRLSSTNKSPKKSQWVQEKVLLFQKLLNDFESQKKTSEQKLLEEMVAMDTGRGGEVGSAMEKQSEMYDDLYHQFTREHLENRQNHVCPVIEDHMPTIRFRRFLKKKHNSKLKGDKTFRVHHRMEQLAESPHPDVQPTPSEVRPTQPGQPPYHIHHLLHHTHKILSPGNLRGRVVSDVFTDDADVNRSMSSDSAYSSLSASSSSRYYVSSDLDSTFRSVTDNRGDVSSSNASNDVSMEVGEKSRPSSEVFDHLELWGEGDVDEARLLRLQVGHSKAGTL